MTNERIAEKIRYDFGEQFYGCVYDFFSAAENLGYQCFSGASRTCLYKPEFGDKVVKLSFGDYDDDCQSFETYYDYFDIENSIYDEAVMVGLGEFFAPNEYIGDFNVETYEYDEEDWENENHITINIKVCVQKKIDTVFIDIYSKCDEKSFKKEKKILSSSTHRYWDICEDAQALILRKHGYKMYNKLMRFIEDSNMDDLHGGNFGIKNGKVVFFDYGGYEG